MCHSFPLRTTIGIPRRTLHSCPSRVADPEDKMAFDAEQVKMEHSGGLARSSTDVNLQGSIMSDLRFDLRYVEP